MGRLARDAGENTRTWADVVWALAGGVPGRYPQAVRDFLIRKWHEVPDPYGVEELRAPDLQLAQFERVGYLEGDCDDVAVLAAALALAARYPVRYVAVAFNGSRVPEHVYAEIQEPTGRWAEIDILRPRGELPEVTGSMVYPLTGAASS